MNLRDFITLESELSTPVAYGRSVNDPCRGDQMQAHVPASLHSELARYILFGIEPSSFLKSVVSCELLSVVRGANFFTPDEIFGIVRFLDKSAPELCFGGRVAFGEWVNIGGLMRHEEVA